MTVRFKVISTARCLDLGYSIPDSSPIMNELGLDTDSGKSVLGLDMDSDVGRVRAACNVKRKIKKIKNKECLPA